MANVCLLRESEGISKFQVSTFTPLSPSQTQRGDLYWKMKSFKKLAKIISIKRRSTFQERPSEAERRKPIKDIFCNNLSYWCAWQRFLPPPADRRWSQKCSDTHRRSGQTRCFLGWSQAWSRNSGVRRRCDRCVWFYLLLARVLPGSSWAGNSGAERETFRNDLGQECPHRCLAHLSCTGGSSHRQHFPLLQIQADIFQDRCDIQVGKEEAGVVHVSVCFVLLLDLLKQLTYSLQQNLQDKRSLFCLDRNKLIRWAKTHDVLFSTRVSIRARGSVTEVTILFLSTHC